MITIADLKVEGLWKFEAHADGSDKHGRFSINFYTADFNGVSLRGFKKQWSSGGQSAGYTVDGQEVATLAEVVLLLNQRFTAGDDARGPAGNDD